MFVLEVTCNKFALVPILLFVLLNPPDIFAVLPPIVFIKFVLGFTNNLELVVFILVALLFVCTVFSTISLSLKMGLTFKNTYYF